MRSSTPLCYSPEKETPPLKRRRLWRILCWACLGPIGLLVGCGGGLPNAEEATAQGILLMGNGSEPKTLDPHLATGVTENKVISALLEGLVTYHPTDDELAEPGVAERWESSEDFTEWTFFLRSTARWSNGDPVTAHDFVYAYERMLSPALGAEYVKMLFQMDNAEAFHRGELADFSHVGVEAVDERTLRFRLVGPTPFFLSMLKHYAWYPVHPATVEAHGRFDRSGAWTHLSNFVGNGPFVMEGWRPNQFIQVAKSPTYWDRAAVRLNGIYFLPIDDVNAEQRMFDSGGLHVTQTVPSNRLPNLLAREAPDLRIEPYLGTYFYRFNTTRPPLDDVRVRRALALAIDRAAIVQHVTQGGQEPAFGYVPPGFDDYPKQTHLSYDPGEARRLLAEAGYPGGEGFPVLYVLFNTQEDHRKIAEAIVSMWNRTLGIEMQLENKEWRVYLEAQTHLDYDLSRAGWIGDYMDPITFLETWTTGNGNNSTGWSDAEYDRLIHEAYRANTGEARMQILVQAEALLMEAMPITPIYFYSRIYRLHPDVKGWHPKRLDNRPYKYIGLE